MKNLMTYIAYTAGIIFILLGLAILFTNLFPAHLPPQLKITMGIVLFLYGAFRMVTSAGKDEWLQAGKNAMKYSLIGFALVTGSYGIYRTVVYWLYP